MGAKVTDERPFEVRPLDAPPVWIYDFGLDYGPDVELQADRVRQIFQDAFAQTWRGAIENDGFNRLVLGAELTCRRSRPARDREVPAPGGSTFSQAYMEEALAGNPSLRGCSWSSSTTASSRHEAKTPRRRSTSLVREIEARLDAIASLDEDRILRSFLSVIEAMLRTSYFQAQHER